MAVTKMGWTGYKSLGALVLGAGLMAGGVNVANNAMAGDVQGSHDGSQGPMGFCGDFSAHRADLLAYAGVKLALTDAQKPAFDQLTAGIKASEQPLQVLCDSLKEGATLPNRLAFMEKMDEARLKALQTVRFAVETFYAELTPDQRETADRLMEQAGHHGGSMYRQPSSVKQHHAFSSMR